jgi:hypothetical protein
MKRVAVLGCGPAGLMAAHAAVLSGWDCVIYSRKAMSNLYGAQYLHAPIPNLDCGDPKLVRYALFGTPEMYRRKVYGDAWDGTTSPEDLESSHAAWDLRRAYADLWALYRELIWDMDITHDMGVNPPQWFGKFDKIISTVPRTIWDDDASNFESTQIWALGDTEQHRVFMAGGRPDDFAVVCNGYKETPWYRIGCIYGHATMEWPCTGEWTRFLLSPQPGASMVTKPLRYNGSAAPDFVHLGRYGEWKKGVLTHDVFFETMKVLACDTIS